jgi:ComF family protein
MLNTFKHHRGLAQGRLLAQLLSDEIRDQYIDHTLPEVIIPVPLHWQRFLWRGYNQSAELGRQLSRELGIPCHTQLLKRIRHTPSQQGLSRKQRLLNLKNAFVIKQALTFQRIALLDDVVTTGTTAMEIARFLRAQGAVEIHLWAIARTPVST